MSRKTLQFVVKISKYCNLRCSYCYEYNELGQKARMPLDKIVQFFVNARNYAVSNEIETLLFIWHGGEPLLVKNDYYDCIGQLQGEIFGDELEYRNSVQSNMTVLTADHLQRFKDRTFFSSLGVSFDVYGDQRVDTNGKLRTDTVISNMQKLMEAEVPFGGICVLAANTLDEVESIYSFYDELGVACRFLPFYRSANEDQVGEHSLSREEIVSGFNRLFDMWLASDNATPVEPIDSYTPSPELP
jgi:uncharacterized protein